VSDLGVARSRRRPAGAVLAGGVRPGQDWLTACKPRLMIAGRLPWGWIAGVA
jgi:hypothetical protein